MPSTDSLTRDEQNLTSVGLILSIFRKSDYGLYSIYSQLEIFDETYSRILAYKWNISKIHYR